MWRSKSNFRKGEASRKSPSTDPHDRNARSEEVWLSPSGYEVSAALPALQSVGGGEALVRSLAEEVLDQHVRMGRRGLAVCAAAPGVGATFVATNLAIALAEVEVATLIIDANLERPSLHELIRPPELGPGLRQLLADDTLRPADVLHRDVMPGLSVLYAGPPNGVESQALSGARFADVVATCLREYQCTLLDAPAASRSAGARDVAIAAGYALLVAQKAESFADDLKFLTSQLTDDQVHLIGAVLNRT